MSERPRRSTRKPARFDDYFVAEQDPERGIKRKAPEATDTQSQLRNLLENSKSILTTIDISRWQQLNKDHQTLLNANTWNMLSEESQTALSALLPPTAFSGYLNSKEGTSKDAMEVDTQPESLNLSVFSDTHFLAAAHTFQDHLYSGWLSSTHFEKLQKYIAGIRDGSLSVSWKDQVWEEENPRPTSRELQNTSSANAFHAKANAGASADLKLQDLIKDGVLQVGDIIAFKRKFLILGITVEKDVLIRSIDKRTNTLSVLFPTNTTRDLPCTLVSSESDVPGSGILSANIHTPQMLETLLLDTDGRVKKDQRPNGNAWKCFTVWRLQKGGASPHTSSPEKGAREVHGTLFYLRGSHYYDLR